MIIFFRLIFMRITGKFCFLHLYAEKHPVKWNENNAFEKYSHLLF